jgi:hypothetical protein
MPSYCGGPTSRLAATVAEQKTSAWSSRPPSSTVKLHEVQPREWPGVWIAVSRRPPSSTTSPSSSTRSTVTGGAARAAMRGLPR